MNTHLHSAVELAQEVSEKTGSSKRVSVAVCPPFVCLEAVSRICRESDLILGAQDVHAEEEGAYTGETSVHMLLSVDCSYVILGHSERRQYNGETDASVRKKVQTAVRAGLDPIICVGEVLAERKAGREEEVVGTQVRAAVKHAASAAHFVIAYEPVWAIGTGETATPDQAQAMHAYIRTVLAEELGSSIADRTLILYGGSMKPGNARDLLQQPDVDGGLIGGASLDSDSFAAIVRAAEEVAESQ